jgi:hypothetical protein
MPREWDQVDIEVYKQYGIAPLHPDAPSASEKAAAQRGHAIAIMKHGGGGDPSYLGLGNHYGLRDDREAYKDYER